VWTEEGSKDYFWNFKIKIIFTIDQMRTREEGKKRASRPKKNSPSLMVSVLLTNFHPNLRKLRYLDLGSSVRPPKKEWPNRPKVPQRTFLS
jgi:hypothetical protein